MRLKIGPGQQAGGRDQSGGGTNTRTDSPAVLPEGEEEKLGALQGEPQGDQCQR